MADYGEYDDIKDDTAEDYFEEDQEIDTLEEAVEALDDDGEALEEQTDTDDDPEQEEQQDDGRDDEDSDLDGENGVLVTLDSGEEVSLGELKKGYYRNNDYTQKTETLAQERKDVQAQSENNEQQSQSLKQSFQNLEEILIGLVPPEPNIALAKENPGEYTHQLAMRNSAISELQQVLQVKSQVDEQIAEASLHEIAKLKSDEEAKLVTAMPVLKDPVKKAGFDAAVRKAALDFGFTDQEIDATFDHRILQVVYFAAMGKRADSNRKNAAKSVVEKPRKGKRPAVAKAPPSKQLQAKKRFLKSGSLEDALALNFE